MVMKFGRGVDYDRVRVDLEGHRSKGMVVRSINMIFQQFVLTMFAASMTDTGYCVIHLSCCQAFPAAWLFIHESPDGNPNCSQIGLHSLHMCCIPIVCYLALQKFQY